jgi:uncharacterized tellurite resistance protein B-like protein
MTTLSPSEAMLGVSLALKQHLNFAQQLQTMLQPEPHVVFDERLAPLDDQLFWRIADAANLNVEEVFAVVSG